jgi:hypothetical protein
MTHDELLERISDYVNSDCDCPECDSRYAPFRGLYKVVKLHKPSQIPDWVPTEAEYICWCAHTYPCPTIQAIEKELG